MGKITMKKILAYISPEKYASLFDVVVAYDGGADVVVNYDNIDISDMKDMVHSCIFTRHPRDLNNTAIFIGGHDVDKGEEMMNHAIKAFEELPDFFRVSVFADPDGAYTTACACAAKIKDALGGVDGLNATILAGTGPVGQRIAVLLAKEGCNVTLTSRKMERSENSCKAIKARYGVDVIPIEVRDDASTESAISGADIVITTGPEGITILPEKIWTKSDNIKIMADLNAVPPYGIGGVSANDDSVEIEGKIGMGALAIGGLKMKCHREIIRQLFEKKNAVFDLEKVYEVTKELI